MSENLDASGPADPAVINETDVPAPGLVAQASFDVAPHNARTRRVIAYGVLSLLAALYLVAVAAWVFHWLTTEEADRLIFALSGIQTLGAAIIGFYFGNDR